MCCSAMHAMLLLPVSPFDLAAQLSMSERCCSRLAGTQLLELLLCRQTYMRTAFGLCAAGHGCDASHHAAVDLRGKLTARINRTGSGQCTWFAAVPCAWLGMAAAWQRHANPPHFENGASLLGHSTPRSNNHAVHCCCCCRRRVGSLACGTRGSSAASSWEAAPQRPPSAALQPSTPVRQVELCTWLGWGVSRWQPQSG